jgi:Helix-turn-helix domain
MAGPDEIAPDADRQILTFKVRAYPTKAQHARFADYLQHTRQLYNAALEERIGCYQKTHGGRICEQVQRFVGSVFPAGAGMNRSLPAISIASCVSGGRGDEPRGAL